MRDARLQVAFGGLHPDRVRSLFDQFGPQDTQRMLARGRVKANARIREAVAVPADARRMQLQQAGIEVIYRGGVGYPQQLGEMPDAPDLLFLRGSLPSVAGVAVVGTRRCTSYGRKIAAEYGAAIADAGWSVVSGLARGIDGSAHRSTVDAGGIGVAVLGSGIDVMYPREHRDLAVALIDRGGAVVSESPPGTPPEAWRFPPRNRIISGLAGVVVVVEATVKGGALITAEAALRHGRSVFSVPGDVGRSSSTGCNLLIRDGAYPVLDAGDLLEALELAMGPPPRPIEQREKPAVADSDRTLFDLIASGVSEVDELIARSGEATAAVLAAIGRLELAGAIRPERPGCYAVIGG